VEEEQGRVALAAVERGEADAVACMRGEAAHG
jgi:hypothetical protein